MKLQEGDSLDIVVEGDIIIIKPVLVIDRSQSWFWSKEWQASEKEAEKDIEKGRVQKAGDVKELMDKLNS
jgi:mRNA interferase RelE/StbE